MSIFIHKDSRVVVQGVTGKEGAFWAKHMKDMGTQVVFGVTPGRRGRTRRTAIWKPSAARNG